MLYEKARGVILKKTPYLGSSEIVQIFTPEGMRSFFIKRRKKNETTHLLSEVEVIYKQKNEGLSTIKELSLERHHLELRRSIECLEAASMMGRALLTSQMEEKPSEKLYQLFTIYLKRLPSFINPKILQESFLLKLLLHEGLLDLSPYCSICSQEMALLSEGESLCIEHQRANSFVFNDAQKKALFTLAFSKCFEELASLKDLPENIDKLFSSLIH